MFLSCAELFMHIYLSTVFSAACQREFICRARLCCFSYILYEVGDIAGMSRFLLRAVELYGRREKNHVLCVVWLRNEVCCIVYCD